MVKRVSFRLTLASSAALLIVVGVMVFLNYTKFQNIFTSFYTSRIDYTIRDVKDTIEFSLRLGLPISDLKNTQDLMERVRDRDEQILTVQMFDPGGKVIFSTEKEFQTVPSLWQNAAESSTDIWFLYERNAMIVGIPLLNAIDQVAGNLVLTYSRSLYDGILKSMLWDMIKIGAVIFAVGTGITMLLALLMFNKTMKGFIRVSRMLEQVEYGQRISSKEIETLAPLEQRFVSICIPIQDALDQVNQVMDRIGGQKQASPPSPEEDKA